MLSRALSLATVMLLICCFTTKPAQAQATNLEAGKSPSQIFAGACTACHKGPRGLLKSVPAGSLPGFLRQHYTTSSDMAALLSSYLISNGAADTRYTAGPAKRSPDGKPAGDTEQQADHQGRRRLEAEPQQAVKPDADGLSSPAGSERHGHNVKRMARPSEVPEATKPSAEGQSPAQAASESAAEGRKSAKHRLSKRGRPGSEELAKPDAAKVEAVKPDTAKPDAAKEESAKTEPTKDDKPKSEGAKEGNQQQNAKSEASKPETAKSEGTKSEGNKSETAKSDGTKSEGTKPEGVKSEAAKIDAPKAGNSESTALRPDPVPAVTPAPPPSAATSNGTSAPPVAAALPPAPSSARPVPAAPATAAGPPAPPISQ